MVNFEDPFVVVAITALSVAIGALLALLLVIAHARKTKDDVGAVLKAQERMNGILSQLRKLSEKER